MIHSDEAWRLICQETLPLPARTCVLADASGHYLAQPLAADRDIPAADRAAMDGFSVRIADLETLPTTLTVIGEAAAGCPCTVSVGPGQAVRIFTGANVPAGADTVVKVEDTELGFFGGDTPVTEVVFPVAVTAGANIFRQSENARRGQPLLEEGTRIDACQAAVAATCGYGTLEVHQRPSVALLQTGTELLSPEAPVAEAHQVRDSNGPMLESALRTAGFPVAYRSTVEDLRHQTAEAIQRAAEQTNAIIMTGGVSAGEYDYVAGALKDCGATIHYHGVAIKPGKPQLFASLPNGTKVFGLPGNPLSAVVGLYDLVLPALKRMAGCPEAACRPSFCLPLAEDIKPDKKRQRIIAARLVTEGLTLVEPLKVVGSADMVTAAMADGAILLPKGAETVPAGTPVQFRSWRLL